MNASQLLVEERPDNTLPRTDPVAGGAVADVACVLLSALAFVCILTDSHTWVRAPAMLVFVLFVPGWTVLRMYRAPANPRAPVTENRARSSTPSDGDLRHNGACEAPGNPARE